jgi:hypothetical protein
MAEPLRMLYAARREYAYRVLSADFLQKFFSHWQPTGGALLSNL